MKYALIFSVLAIAGVVLGAIFTYPAYQKQQTDAKTALELEEREKGKFLYETNCATKCHIELNRATLANPEKYIVSDDKSVYPPATFTDKFWDDLLNNKADTRCKGITNLDKRTIELLYKYLGHEAAENDPNAEIALNEMKDDIIKGLEILQAGKGAEVFANSCKGCHSENLARAFTDIEWRIELDSYIKIHEKQENAALPEGEALQQLKLFLKSSSASNETDAQIIRNLLRQLRASDNAVVDNNGSSAPELIPDEIAWNDLDWQYPYEKSMAGLLEKFPDKPIIMELTNKYS